jgi:hypothetical protein
MPYIPNTVNLSSEDPDNEITWITTPTTSLGFLMNARWGTIRPLLHRSNPATGDLRDKTWTITCTNFNMTTLPDVITGLQLDLSGQRNGRIIDETIQLTYQDQAIGDNNFLYVLDSEGHFYLNNQTTYGGPTDTWGVALTPEMLQDPSFGIILKFQSHPYYPHSCGMFLDTVLFTVY